MPLTLPHVVIVVQLNGNEVALVYYLDSLFLFVVYQLRLVPRLHSLVND